MDKYEYRVRADEIKALIAREEYPQAAEIADTIDWRRVKSVMMLCTISDLYKINRRYEDARDMLLLAYERRPGGKTICYSLCELSIKTGEFVQAVEYYKEYVQAAPKDPGRYILQYKLYEAQDVSLEERIDVLEEFKKRDYREKWAYELAYLYHRIGLATRCVEECDELILWFGEGKYVTKAMELKMLHQPLSPSQQERYDHRFDPVYEEDGHGEIVDEGVGEASDYDNYQGYYDEDEEQDDSAAGEYPEEQMLYEEQSYSETFLPEEPEEAFAMGAGDTKVYEAQRPEDELDIYVKPMDMGRYNTLNLQAELAAGLKEVLDDDHKVERNNAITRAIVAPMLEESDTESLDYPQIEEVDEEDLEPETGIEEMEESEVFFGETGEIINIASQTLKKERVEPPSDNTNTVERTMETLRQQNLTYKKPEVSASQAMNVEPPKELAHVLSQESDGQLTLVMPEDTSIEKQITGQMNFNDILAEWERMKKESEERHREAVRQRVLEQTGDMFTEFEASVRDGLLEKLENDTTGTLDSVDNIPKDLTEETIEEFIGDTAEEAEAEFTENTAGETVADFLGDIARESVTSPTGDIAEGIKADLVENAVETAAEKLMAESAGVAAKDFMKNAAGNTAEEIVEDIIGDTAGEIVEDFTGDNAGKVVEDLTEDAVEENLADFMEDAAEETVADLIEDSAQDMAEEINTPTEVAAEKNLGDSISEEIEEFAEDIVEETPEESAEETIEETVEDVAEPVPEILAENAAEEQEEDSVEDTIPEQSEDVIQDEPTAEDSQPHIDEASRERIPENLAYQTGSANEPPEEDSGKPPVRALTKEEKELFGPFIQSKSAREQLVKVIDNINMAAYEGNVIITGEEGMDTLTLAKNIVREVKMIDSNFSGKVAKISGRSFANKSVEETIGQLPGGALIIQHASAMSEDVADELYMALQQENQGIIVILEDTKKAMDKFLAQNSELAACFTARMDVEAMSNDTLVAFGRQYAREMEYSIDEFGILALHTKIEERQTIDHVVTVVEVKKLVDDAIRHANRKTLGHFFDVLFAKRYDEEDMIILGEKDFI